MKKQKVSLYNKLIWYFKYRRIMKLYDEYLAKEFNMQKDKICRYYTILNLTEDDYDRFKEDTAYFNNTMFLKRLQEFIVKYGLMDILHISKIEQIDPYNYLYVIEYKWLNMASFIRKSVIISLLTLIAGIVVLFNV